MKKFLILVLLLLLGTPLWAGAQPAIRRDTPPSEPFFFIQISDPQLGFREKEGFAEGERLLAQTVKTINALRPAFVVVTGDMVNASGNAEQYAAYRRLIGRVRKDIPVFHLPGNHDLGHYTPAHKQAYLDRYGYDRFAFRYGDCAFVGIDSCPIKDGCAEAEAEQYAWLEQRLSEAQDARLRFVFLHCPVVLHERHEAETYSNFPEAMRVRYIDLFARYGVAAVLAGHLHDTAGCVVDGIEMVTCGPSGKPLGKGFSGLNIVTVYPDDSFTHAYTAPAAARNPLH